MTKDDWIAGFKAAIFYTLGLIIGLGIIKPEEPNIPGYLLGIFLMFVLTVYGRKI